MSALRALFSRVPMTERPTTTGVAKASSSDSATEGVPMSKEPNVDVTRSRMADPRSELIARLRLGADYLDDHRLEPEHVDDPAYLEQVAHYVRSAADALEASRRPEQVQGHTERCYYCDEPCDSLAGNPALWPVGLSHADDPGVMKWHHAGCVSRRLEALAESGDRPATPAHTWFDCANCGTSKPLEDGDLICAWCWRAVRCAYCGDLANGRREVDVESLPVDVRAGAVPNGTTGDGASMQPIRREREVRTPSGDEPASTTFPAPSADPRWQSIRNLDTADSREFWEFVARSVQEWKEQKPQWARELERIREAMPTAEPSTGAHDG